MAYDNSLLRPGVAALIPEEYTNEILTGLTAQSAALTMFRSLPMSTKQNRMPVLSALPTAYFVDGDTGLIQSTEISWANKYLNAEKVACIVPIPKDVLDDQGYDLWGMAVPLIQGAMARTVDAAVIFGTNKPSTWPDSVVAGITAAGHNYARGTNNAAAGGIAADYSEAFALVEVDGYDVTGIIANTTHKGLLRNARDANGVKHTEVDSKTVYGVEPMYVLRGLWPSAASTVEAIVGDFTQGIMGTRKDMEAVILDQAVITDESNNIIYNLAQQDMVALKVTMRVAFQIANTINYDNGTEATRYPWASVRRPA